MTNTQQQAYTEDLTVSEHPAALALLKSLRGDRDIYWKIRHELSDYFILEIIGGGKPWTPSLKVKWKKQLTEQLPAKPDWLAIEQELKQLEGTK